MPSTNPAKNIVVKLPIPVTDDRAIELVGGDLTHLRIRRMNGGERLKHHEQKYSDDARGQLMATRSKLLVQIDKAGQYDEASEQWSADSVDSLLAPILSLFDTFSEDAAVMAMIAIDFGYGTMEGWESSDEYKRLQQL